MKKLVLAAAIMMLVPFSAFALETMDDDAMAKLTAQEGVTITFDNVVISQTPADIAWGDADGTTRTWVTYDSDTNGDGHIDSSDDPTNHTTTAGDGRVFVDYGATGSDVTTINGSLTIDVATAAAGGFDVGSTKIAADTSFVKIGLPSISQSAAAKTMTIAMDGALIDDTAPTTGVLGTLYQNGGSSTVSGSIYIYGH